MSGYTKMFSLKSHDYQLDHRDDELIFEYHELEITTSSSKGHADADTNLDEVVGLVNLNYVDEALSGSDADGVALTTDGVVASAAVTVSLVTGAQVSDAAHTVRFFLVGRYKAVDA